MNLTDATLVLLLAARIHGTDEAVRASAKSVVKKLPRSKRDLIYKVIDSRSRSIWWNSGAAVELSLSVVKQTYVEWGKSGFFLPGTVRGGVR